MVSAASTDPRADFAARPFSRCKAQARRRRHRARWTRRLVHDGAGRDGAHRGAFAARKRRDVRTAEADGAPFLWCRRSRQLRLPVGQAAQWSRKIAMTRQKSRESTSTSRPRPRRRTTSANSSSKVRPVGARWARGTILTPCLFAELNASTAPYSKSHNRRLRRAARPQNNLVTTLQEVEAVLPSIEPAFEMSDEADAFEVEAEGAEAEEYEQAGTATSGKGKTGGKGKEKLTAKKRQRVLCVPSFF